VAWDELLRVYLNDHLAGATSGVDLADKLRANNEGTPLGAVLSSLAGEIKQDRATLVGLMESLGINKSTVKQAAGWGFEKLTRLKMNERLTGSAELTRLLELEMLSLGIEGKLLMWRTLRDIAKVDARLAATDFERLIDRARQQRETLEPHRLAAVGAVSP
jgi:hypothetical protein